MGSQVKKGKVVTYAHVMGGYFENYIIDPKEIKMNV